MGKPDMSLPRPRGFIDCEIRRNIFRKKGEQYELIAIFDSEETAEAHARDLLGPDTQ